MAHRSPGYEVMMITLFFHLIVYGVYAVTFSFSTYLLVARRAKARRRHNNWLFITASFFMFGLLSVRTICDIWVAPRTLFFRHEAASMQAGYIIAMRGPLAIVKAIAGAILLLVGEILLVYRCFVVHLYQWKPVVLPTVLLMIATTSNSATVYYTTVSPNEAMMQSTRFSILNNITLASVFVTNVVTTGLISRRLWRVHRNTAQLTVTISTRRPSTLTRLRRVLIETGLLYTLFVIVSIGAEFAGLAVAYSVQGIMYAAIGISYELVVILGHFTWGAQSSSRVMSRLPASIMASMRSQAHYLPSHHPTDVTMTRPQELADSERDLPQPVDVKDDETGTTCSHRIKHHGSVSIG